MEGRKMPSETTVRPGTILASTRFARDATLRKSLLAPQPSMIETPILPRALDGSLLSIDTDSDGRLVSAHTAASAGIRQAMSLVGRWPEQDIVFEENGTEYLRASAYLKTVSR